MIHVQPQPEPKHFDALVRQKGLAWLNKHQNSADASNHSIKFKEYWLSCIDDLYNCYHGVCAYLGLQLNRYQGITTDHFHPKQKYPMLAYEWSNYRLASSLINSRKGNSDDVLDPFVVKDHWFQLNFFTGKLKPDNSLPMDLVEKINYTINKLRLNDSKLCEARLEYYHLFHSAPEILQTKAPLVYIEAKRQNML